MATREERMKEITDRLQTGLEELFNSEKYTEYLRVMSQFHHYSFNNTLLIALQKPDATLVAGYHAWEKKFNRHVMKGEKGIQIIAPAPVKEKLEQDKVDPETGKFVIGADGKVETEEVTVTIPRFKISTVFDLSQTDGEPLPELGVEELTASVENYEIFMEAIRSVSPVPIRFDEIQGGAKGYYNSANKEIVLQAGMAELQTMKTAVHETTHALLHDRDVMQAKGIQKDQMTRECEAESCAFAVLSHFGLDTSDYSFPYIGGWSSSREMKELKSSMDTIRRTASEIIDGIESSMREQILERDADRYEIYQIGEESPAGDYKFMGLDFVHDHGLSVRKEDYELVYTAPLKAEETLDSLYEKFNIEHPADFTGHALSVSDVVVMHQGGEDHAWFVDSFGFAEVPEFLELPQEKTIETPEIKDQSMQKPEIESSEMETQISGETGRQQPGRTPKDKAEPKLTFYVAECMEYPVLGEYHEAATLEEAMKLYDQIPADRRNSGRGIGFNLDDGSEYAGSYPLVQDGKVVTKMIDLVEHYRSSPLVQQAVADAKRYYPDIPEIEHPSRETQEESPVIGRVAAEKSVKEPARESSTGSRKESVLKALRARQAQVKEREKQQPVKQHDRKKEGQSL